MKTFKPLVALAAMSLGTSAFAVPLFTIDDFNNDPLQAVSTPSPASNELSYGGAVGGFRDLHVTKTGGSFNIDLFAGDLDPGNPGGETASYGAGPTTLGFGQITWDGNDSPTAVDKSGLVAVDLTVGGTATQFEFDILSSDNANGIIKIEVWDDNNTANSVAGSLTSLATGTAVLDFSSLTLTGTGTINDVLDSAGAIQLTMDGQSAASWDVSLSFFGTGTSVPAPAGLALVGLVALGLSRRRAQS